jgi:nitrate reductase gamma subunit
MWDNFFFIGLPYITIVLFFGGLVFRGFSGIVSSYRGKWDWTARGDFLWTTRSTGFFGRASIGPASLCMHWGLIVLFIAHVAGFIGGAYNLASWVDFFRWAGLGAGILFSYGIIFALVRRLVILQVKAMSTVDDYLVLVFLIVIGGFGLYQSAVELVFGISYSAGPWIGSIFRLQPDVSAIAGAPLINKLHIVFALLFFAYFPFTKLVHVFSFPFSYIARPYISMRRYVALRK